MLPYQGSKSIIGRWIKEFIPKNIWLYCEPFAGMFKIYYLMALDHFKNLEYVIYSDCNDVNANIFRCVSENYQRLLEIVNNLSYPSIDFYLRGEKKDPFYERIFYMYKKSVYRNNYSPYKLDYEAGARYAWILCHSMNGDPTLESRFIDYKLKYLSKYTSFINKLNDPSYHDHFNAISEVENLDFEDCIRKYDGKDAFFYIDPPYKDKEHYYGRHNFDPSTHKRLAKCINSIKGRWILSYYYFDELETLYPKDQYLWFSKSFKRPSANQKGEMGEEYIIMNYKNENIIDGKTICHNLDLVNHRLAA